MLRTLLLLIGLALLAYLLWPKVEERPPLAALQPGVEAEREGARVLQAAEATSGSAVQAREELSTAPVAEAERPREPAQSDILVSGRVVLDGRPVPGAEVLGFAESQLSWFTTSKESAEPILRTRADEQGHYSVRVPLATALHARAPGLGPLVHLRVMGGDGQEFEQLDLELHHLRAFDVLVVDIEGQLVAGAKVKAALLDPVTFMQPGRDPAYSYQPMPNRVFKTDATGRARGELPDMNCFALKASKGEASGQVTLDSSSVEPLEIILRTSIPSSMTGEAKLRVFGRLVNRQGQGLAGAKLRWNGETCQSDEHGQWSFGAHPLETMSEVLAAAEGYSIGRHELDSVESDVGPILLVLEPSVAIRGVLVDAEGQGLEGKTIKIEGEAPILGSLWETQTQLSVFRRERATTGEEGHFALEGLAPGQYRVVYSDLDDGRVAISTATAPTEDLRLVVGQVDVPEVRLVGTVRDGSSGAALAGVRLIASKAWASGSISVRTAFSDEDGHFVLRGLLPGRMHVGASASGYAKAVTADEEYELGEHELTVTLLAQRTLRVFVEDPSGDPIASARIYVVDPAGNSLQIDTGGGVSISPASTAIDGSVYLHGLPATLLTLKVHPAFLQMPEVIEVDLREDEQRELRVRTKLYPLPSHATRQLELRLVGDGGAAASLPEGCSFQVFDEGDRLVSYTDLEFVDGKWISTFRGTGITSQFFEPKAKVLVPASTCRILMEIPGREPRWIEVPAKGSVQVDVVV